MTLCIGYCHNWVAFGSNSRYIIAFCVLISDEEFEDQTILVAIVQELKESTESPTLGMSKFRLDYVIEKRQMLSLLFGNMHICI